MMPIRIRTNCVCARVYVRACVYCTRKNPRSRAFTTEKSIKVSLIAVNNAIFQGRLA